MDIAQLHARFLECGSVCTDTRKLTKNTLFFSLKGENFNGNAFAQKALENGARYVVIDEAKYNTSDKYILVDNVLKTLQELAKFHKKHLNLPIVALTGSNGKTTTKELINAVLSKHYKTVATKGNLNNHIGVPLTLLSMDQSTDMGIVEMGANHLKEIEFLCTIAQPDYGYITNFGKAHLEGFGNLEGVIKGKSELYDYLISNEKTVFYNADDTVQAEQLNFYKKVFGFSTTTKADVQITMTQTAPFVALLCQSEAMYSNLIGKYNFANIAAAVAIGLHFKIPMDNIKKAIESYTPSNNRSQIITTDKHKIVLDAYNANPTSMAVALDNFNAMPDTPKTVILGDMFELGEEAEKEHQNIVDFAESLNFENILLTGKNFNKTNSDKAVKLKDFEALKSYLKEHSVNGTILIKGSRGMALERILELL